MSDPQERAWYDRHRATILSAASRKHQDEDAPDLDDLLAYFNTDVYDGFSDSPRGFFAVYRELFEYLEEFEAEETMQNDRYAMDYRSKGSSSSFTTFTSFGSLNTPFEPSLRQFYDKWLHFTSHRTFDESDRYQPTFHDNRRMRRAMKKENSKERERLRREFSDTVRELAAFVRKRDPRYIRYQKARTEQREREEAAKKARERERREAEVAAFVEQDWAKLGMEELARAAGEFYSDASSTDALDNQGASSSDESIEFEEFYCAPCKKLFKNMPQWRNHEKSKKHRTTLLSMGIDPDADVEDDLEETGREASSLPDLEKDKPEEPLPSPADDTETLTDSLASLNLKEKAKEEEKGAKGEKKARRSKEGKDKKQADDTFKCNVCELQFPSRNKLFQHVKEEDHMLAPAKSSSKGTKSRRK